MCFHPGWRFSIYLVTLTDQKCMSRRNTFKLCVKLLWQVFWKLHHEFSITEQSILIVENYLAQSGVGIPLCFLIRKMKLSCIPHNTRSRKKRLLTTSRKGMFLQELRKNDRGVSRCERKREEGRGRGREEVYFFWQKIEFGFNISKH